MVGTILSTALGAAGNIAGGVLAGRETRKAVEDVEQQKQDNEQWYARRSSEDPTMRADAQRALAMTEEIIKRRNEEAAGTQAVMGGTNEAVRANTEANAKAVSDTESSIAAQGEARKDAYEQQYMQRRDALRQEINQLRMGKSANIAKAAQGVGQAAAKVATSVDTVGASDSKAAEMPTQKGEGGQTLSPIQPEPVNYATGYAPWQEGYKGN